MNKLITPLIQETFHYDAKPSADEESCPFWTRIAFICKSLKPNIDTFTGGSSDDLLLVYVKVLLSFQEKLTRINIETGVLQRKIFVQPSFHFLTLKPRQDDEKQKKYNQD